MTSQLADAKAMSERQQLQVKNAKAYLESVLAHLSSGVLVVDEYFQLRTVNGSGHPYTGCAAARYARPAAAEIAVRYPLLRPFCEAVMMAFDEAQATNGRTRSSV
ncbi:MAG: hypothetical protein WDM70_09480 [Nitrosomonadales bacterium]